MNSMIENERLAIADFVRNSWRTIEARLMSVGLHVQIPELADKIERGAHWDEQAPAPEPGATAEQPYSSALAQFARSAVQDVQSDRVEVLRYVPGEHGGAFECSAAEAPQPVTLDMLNRLGQFHGDARRALEARVAKLTRDFDAFRSAATADIERPSKAPVTREEFDRVASRVTDLLTMTEATRAVIDEDKGRFDQLAATVATLDKRIDALRARLDGQRIAGCDLASRVDALEKLSSTLQRHHGLSTEPDA